MMMVMMKIMMVPTAGGEPKLKKTEETDAARS